ncbi:MAG: hypothetical protein J0G30_10975 [Actinomycetales bacterium]|nr:hypothetical protein [Actinomycetales bacterium]
MSDDTPTQRLPESAGDAPTQRLAPVDDGTELRRERGRSRGLLIALVVGGAVLLLVVVVLLILLLGDRGPAPVPTSSATPTASLSPSPTPSATPSASPSPTPTPTETVAPPPPPPPSPIVSYTVSTRNVDCSSGDPVPLTFNWNTTGESVTFAVGTDTAESAPYQTDLPPVGGITIDYQCGQPSGQQIYSIATFHNGSVIGRQSLAVRE